MRTEPVGVPTYFQNLASGDFFVSTNGRSHIDYGIAVKMLDGVISSALILNYLPPDAGAQEAAEIVQMNANESVWKIENAILRPKLGEKCALSLDDRGKLGDLVLTTDGAYVVCRHRGSIRQIDVQTGSVRSSGLPPMVVFRAWEAVVMLSETQECVVLFQKH